MNDQQLLTEVKRIALTQKPSHERDAALGAIVDRYVAAIDAAPMPESIGSAWITGLNKTRRTLAIGKARLEREFGDTMCATSNCENVSMFGSCYCEACDPE